MRVHAWLARLRAYLTGHKFLRSVGVLLGGTAVGQGVLLLASPVMSRLYTPAEWGTLAAFTALTSMLLPVSSLRLEIAITVVDEPREAAGVAVLCLLILSAFIVATAGGVLVGGGPLAAWTEAPALAPLLWLLPVAITLGGVYSIVNYWAVRRGEFSVISRSEMTRPIAKVATQIGLGFFHPGPAGLVLGEVTGRFGGLIPLARQARGDLAPHLGSLDTPYLKRILRRHWRFPVFTGGGALLSGLAAHVSPLLMAGLFGPQAAGWLALGERAVLMPTSFLGRSVSKVYLGRAGSLAGRDPAALRRLFLRTSLMMFVIGAVPAIVLLVAGPDLFALVFGEEWRRAGEFARWLAPLFLGQFVLSPLGSTLHLIRHHGTKLTWDAVRLMVVCTAFVLPDRLGMDADVAVAGYGMGVAVLYAVLYLLSVRGIGRDYVRLSADEESRRPAGDRR